MTIDPQALPLVCATILVGGLGAVLAFRPKAFNDFQVRYLTNPARIRLRRISGLLLGGAGVWLLYEAAISRSTPTACIGAASLGAGLASALWAQAISAFLARRIAKSYNPLLSRFVGSISLLFGSVLVSATAMCVHW